MSSVAASNPQPLTSNINKVYSVIVCIITVLVICICTLVYFGFISQTCSQKQKFMMGAKGMVFVLVVCVISMTLYFANYIIKVEYKTVSDEDRLHYLKTWHNRFWYLKGFFIVIALGLVALNHYTTFFTSQIGKSPNLFVSECVVMLACGFVAGLIQVYFTHVCLTPQGMMSSVLTSMAISIGMYLLLEFSGFNAMLTIIPETESTSTSSCGVLLGQTVTSPLEFLKKKIGIEILLVIIAVFLTLFLTVFIIIAGNGIGFSNFDHIQKCYLVSLHPSISTVGQGITIATQLDSRQYRMGVILFMTQWFIWAFVMNIGYLFVRVNRNGGNSKSITSSFLEIIFEVTVKFWGIGMLLGFLTHHQLPPEMYSKGAGREGDIQMVDRSRAVASTSTGT